MGQAFDSDGRVLGEVYGETKAEVFNELMRKHADAAEIRIRTMGPGQVPSVGHAAPGGPSVEMPRYSCRKVVWALKIRDIVDLTAPGNDDDGSRLLIPAEAGYGAVSVSRDYMGKHRPQVGGYYVVYKDGYQSFSPGDAFEDGYRRS